MEYWTMNDDLGLWPSPKRRRCLVVALSHRKQCFCHLLEVSFNCMYRGERQVSDWVGLTLICPLPRFHPLPSSAWADGKLSEVAEQVGQMGEQSKSKSTQPSL